MPRINPKILIIAGVLLLVILIAVTVFVSSISTNRQNQQNQPTLLPTGFFESEGNSSIDSDIFAREGDENVDDLPNITDEEISRLEELRNRLPLESKDFIIGYSPKLGEFFVSLKTSNGSEAFRQYLAANGLTNVFNELPGMFNISDLPLDQAIREREEEAQREDEALEQGLQSQLLQLQQQSSQQNNQRTRRERSEGENQFLNLMRTFLSIDTGNDIDELNSYLGITPTTQPSSSGGDGGSSGGGASGGGNNNLCEGTGLRCRPDCLDGETQENNLSCSGPNRVCCKNESGGGSNPISATAQELLNNPRLVMSSVARYELRTGIIHDQRLINIIASILQDHTLNIWNFKGNRTTTSSGGMSNHYYGRAADIGAVDGKAVNGSNTGAHDIVVWATRLDCPIRPGEMLYPTAWADEWFDPLIGWQGNDEHYNHLHIGYYPTCNNPRP